MGVEFVPLGEQLKAEPQSKQRKKPEPIKRKNSTRKAKLLPPKEEVPSPKVWAQAPPLSRAEREAKDEESDPAGTLNPRFNPKPGERPTRPPYIGLPANTTNVNYPSSDAVWTDEPFNSFLSKDPLASETPEPVIGRQSRRTPNIAPPDEVEELDSEEKDLLNLMPEDLKKILLLAQQIGGLTAEQKTSIDPKAIRRINNLNKIKKIAPQELERAILHGNEKSLVGIGNMLGYSGTARSNYVRLFIAKTIQNLGHTPAAQRLLSIYRNTSQMEGADINMALHVETLRMWCKKLTNIVNNRQVRDSILDQVFSGAAIFKKYRRQPPMLPRVKFTQGSAGEKIGTIDHKRPMKRAERYHPRKIETTGPEMANLIFEIKYPQSMTKESLRLRSSLAEVISKNYYGTGSETGQLARLQSVYEAYEVSQQQREESRLRFEAGDESYENVFDDEDTYDRYFDFIGLPRSPVWMKTLPSDTLTWRDHFAAHNLKINPLNSQSDAGAPFFGAKKGQVFVASDIRQNELYQACTHMGAKALKTAFPEIGVIDLKGKADVYPLTEQYKLNGNPDMEGWLKANRNQEKVRTIFNPCTTSNLMNLLSSAIFKNTSSWRTLGELETKLKTKEMFSLKSFPFVNLTYDRLIRRIFGHAPFEETDRFMKMIYSDNGYIVDTANDNWDVPIDNLTICPEHPRREYWEEKVRLARAAGKKTVNIEKEAFLGSVDGRRMESSSDKKMVNNFLKHTAIRLGAPKHLANYMVKAGILSIVGGTGVIGNKAMVIMFQGSGNSLTFPLNDVILHAGMEMVEPGMNFEQIKEIFRRLGVTMTLERVTLIGPRGTAAATPGFTTHIDLLGFGIGVLDRLGDGGVYVPVLEWERFINALFANKRGDKTTKYGEAAKMISLFMYGGWNNPALSFVIKARLKQLAEDGVRQLTEEVEEGLPPLDSTTVSAINSYGPDKISAYIVAELFGNTFIPKDAVVHTAPNVPSAREWGEINHVVNPNDNSRYLPENRDVLLEALFNDLQALGEKIPVASTEKSGGRIVKHNLNKNSRVWKRLRIKSGFGNRKQQFLETLSLQLLAKYPELSSRFEQDLLESQEKAAVEKQKVLDARAERKEEKRKLKELAVVRAKIAPSTDPKLRNTYTLMAGGSLKLISSEELALMQPVSKKWFMTKLLELLNKAPLFEPGSAEQRQETSFGGRLAGSIESITTKQHIIQNLLLVSVQSALVDVKWSDVKRSDFTPRVNGKPIQLATGARDWFAQAVNSVAHTTNSLTLKINGRVYAMGDTYFTPRLFNSWFTRS
jgi:hypothetical protein